MKVSMYRMTAMTAVVLLASQQAEAIKIEEHKLSFAELAEVEVALHAQTENEADLNLDQAAAGKTPHQTFFDKLTRVARGAAHTVG